jgi:DNA primase
MIEQAQPVVAYVIDVATEDLDLTDPKAKTAVVQQVLPLIEDVVDPIEREHYRQLLARRLKLDERILHQVTIPARQKRERPGKAVSTTKSSEKSSEVIDLSVLLRGSHDASEMRKADFLRQCMTYPQIIMLVNKKLAQNQQEIVSASDFSRPDDRVLWHRLYQLQGRWTVVTEGELWDSLDDELLRERIQTLLDLPETPESELERLPNRLVISILDWRLERVRSLINEVEQLFHEAKTQNNPDATNLYSRQLRELPLQVLSINKARAASSMTSRRNSQQSRRSSPRAAKTNDS